MSSTLVAPDSYSAISQPRVESAPAVPTRATWTVAIFLAIGTAIRIYLFLANPSPWLDEQQLSVNIASRSFAGLARELDFAQSAPLFFLWLVRVSVVIGGVSEHALRAVPVVAGIALVPAVWLLARRMFGEPAGSVALAITAVSPVLIRYSNEIKPYGLDALVAIGLIWLALDCLETPERTSRWTMLAAAGALSVWLSTAAIFTLASTGIALLVAGQIRQRRALVLRVVACGLGWVASFAAAYVTVYRAGAENGYMQRFWSGSFLVHRPLGAVKQLLDIVGGMFSAIFLHRDMFAGAFAPARIGYVVALLVLCALGTWRAGRLVGTARLMLLGLPFVVALAASGAQRYPLSVRLLLFAAPAFIIFAAVGVDHVATLLMPGARVTRLAGIGALLLAPAILHAAAEVSSPDRREQAARVIAGVAAESAADRAPVYLFSSSLAAWLLYTTDWTQPDTARLSWVSRLARQPGGPISYNAPPRLTAVTRAGDEYRRVHDGRIEIYGLSSGVLETATAFGDAPDAGWAVNEARRIAAVARPCAWLVAVHYHESEMNAMIAALGAIGISSEIRQANPGAALVRSCLSPAAAPASAPGSGAIAAANGHRSSGRGIDQGNAPEPGPGDVVLWQDAFDRNSQADLVRPYATRGNVERLAAGRTNSGVRFNYSTADFDNLIEKNFATTKDIYIRYWYRMPPTADPTCGDRNGSGMKWFMAWRPDPLPRYTFGVGNDQFGMHDNSSPDMPNSVLQNVATLPSFFSTHDGQWHKYTVHIVTDRGLGDGTGETQLWVDGILVADDSKFNYHHEPTGISLIQFPGTLVRWFSGCDFYIDIDDLAIWHK